MNKKPKDRHLVTRTVSIEQAWVNLASDILLSAIEDARQTQDLLKQHKARSFLLSPAAKLIFETLDIYIDIEEWVKADCQQLDGPERAKILQ